MFQSSLVYMKRTVSKKRVEKTSLYCGKKVLKNDIRIEALGSLDELMSMLGVFRGMSYFGMANLFSLKISALIKDIQIRLFTVGTEIATDEVLLSKVNEKISRGDVAGLEKLNKNIKDSFCIPDGFVVPGGKHIFDGTSRNLSPILDVCRALTRRLERDLISLSLKMENPENMDFLTMIEWINRLSSVFWSLARALEIFKLDNSLKLNDVKKSEINYDLDWSTI